MSVTVHIYSLLILFIYVLINCNAILVVDHFLYIYFFKVYLFTIVIVILRTYEALIQEKYINGETLSCVPGLDKLSACDNHLDVTGNQELSR